MRAGDSGRAAYKPLLDDPRLRAAITAARTGSDAALIRVLSEGRVQDALRDPRHAALTARGPVPDAGIEALVTALRRLNLMTVMRRPGGLPPRARLDGDVAAFVARQCFLAGYIFAETAEEADALRALTALLAGDPTATGLVGYDLSRGLPSAYLAYAAYRPLSTLVAAYRLGAIEPELLSPAQAELLRMQVNEPAVEARLAVDVDPPESAALAAVPIWQDDGDAGFRPGLGVSGERPSPRWRSAEAAGAPAGGAFKRALVVGCGTGQRAVSLAARGGDACVRAVDPDRRALAYAWRMANEAGIDNLRFIRADIADMAVWDGAAFDLIDATGLTARLADVETGLAVLRRLLVADGIMCFDLPSLAGQRHVMAARAFVEREGYAPRLSEIRRLRARLRRLPGKALARAVIDEADFFALGPCTRLLFGGPPRGFTLAEVAALLSRLGLAFVALEATDAGVAKASADGAGGDLAWWQRLERANPDLFRQGYRIRCRRV